LPRLALTSLCSPGRTWTFDPPASTSWVAGIIGLMLLMSAYNYTIPQSGRRELQLGIWTLHQRQRGAFKGF
jgi:hypothetical protein